MVLKSIDFEKLESFAILNLAAAIQLFASKLSGSISMALIFSIHELTGKTPLPMMFPINTLRKGSSSLGQNPCKR